MQTIRNGFGMLRTADPSELSTVLNSLLPFEEQDKGIEVRTGVRGRMRPGIRIVRQREVGHAARKSPGIQLPLVYAGLREKVPELNESMRLSFAGADLVQARSGDEFIVLYPDTEGRQQLIEERRKVVAALGVIASPFTGFSPENAPLDMTIAYAKKGANRTHTSAMLSIATLSLPLTVELGPATFSPSAQQLTQMQRW